MQVAPTRPVLRYHGGKWRLAPWIIEHFPPHSVYVEPYCGAASVFMRKARVHGEVLNDLDGDIVNLFAVLRDPNLAAELERLVRLTPFARAEFYLAYEPTDDPVERARRTVARTFMGFGTTSRRKGRTGFRARTYTRRNQTGPADFATWPDCIEAYTDRLRGVLIENKPALELIPIHDGPETLFYVDPPYPHSARSSMYGASEFRYAYQHEMTDNDHRQLAEVLHSVQGMVVLSGYPCELYDELFGDWYQVQRKALADGARERTECLWLNDRAAEHRRQVTLW